MNFNSAVNLDDIRKVSKRLLPKIAYDFIEGGVDDETGLDHNRAAFAKYRILPRYLVDVSKRDHSATIFGQTFAMPFGISPTGAASLFRPGGDLMLAEVAAQANIPFLLSTNSGPSIERILKIAPKHGWMQIYGARNPAVTEDMVRRGRDSALTTIVFTVDVPIQPRRERNLRNGFKRPFRLKGHVLLEALMHPSWVINHYRTGGMPMMENWQPYAPPGSNADQVADFFVAQHPAYGQTWETLERLRRLWPGKLIIKGLLHPDDAVKAVDIGVDGIIVSNHGARQLDFAPSPLEMLPAINAAVGDRTTLIFESGIRRGSDIIIALCLGAKFTLAGRPTLYGITAAKQAGAKKVLDIMRTEIDTIMTQMGCPSLDKLGPHFLWRDGKSL